MRRQRHLDGAIHVEPLRVVIHFLGGKRRARHEPERLIEVLEDEFLRDRVAAVDLAPLGEACKCGFTRGAFELCHRTVSLLGLRKNSRRANACAMEWADAQAPALDEIEKLAVEAFA